MATHPVLVKQLDVALLQALELALASHRYALGLDEDNADTLFNTAQVLSSCAEELAKDPNIPDTEALRLLEEALELQNRCLALQEYQYTENQRQEAAMREAMESNQLDTGSVPTHETLVGDRENSPREPEQQWASVVEPVTKDSLLDTIEAQLSTLTTLCGLLGSSSGIAPASSLAWVEEYAAKVLKLKLPAYLDSVSARRPEMALAKANFTSALLGAGFRSGNLDPQTYKRERDVAFADPDLALTESSAASIANASSMIAFNTALAENLLIDIVPLSALRWNALGVAVDSLTQASKLAAAPADDVTKSHMLRGDASLLQYQLSRPPTHYQTAISNATSLLKNAEVFFRNASRVAQDEDERDEALLKEAVVLASYGERSVTRLVDIVNRRGNIWTSTRIEDMVDEGLIVKDDLVNLHIG
jgi:hypothetical protein